MVHCVNDWMQCNHFIWANICSDICNWLPLFFSGRHVHRILHQYYRSRLCEYYQQLIQHHIGTLKFTICMYSNHFISQNSCRDLNFCEEISTPAFLIIFFPLENPHNWIRRQDYQASNMGHSRAGTFPNNYLLLLPWCSRYHSRLRHHWPGGCCEVAIFPLRRVHISAIIIN